MLHSDPANAAGTAKIPSTRLVERTFKGQRNQIEPALSKIEFLSPVGSTAKRFNKLLVCATSRENVPDLTSIGVRHCSSESQ